MIPSDKIENFLKLKKFKFIHLKSVQSTMSEIKKFYNGVNICMIADEQTAGFGRRGNKWISPKGNIYLSFLIKYDLKIEDHFIFTAITVNSIISLLSKYLNEKIVIKWPNDVIINNKKISGIMTEITELNNERCIIIGIGINISTAPQISDYQTCCLNDFNKKVVYKNFLLEVIECYFEEYNKFINKEYDEVLNNFRAKLQHKGACTYLQYPNGDTEYVFLKDVNHDGSLLIEKNGKEKSIFSARIINDIN